MNTSHLSSLRTSDSRHRTLGATLLAFALSAVAVSPVKAGGVPAVLDDFSDAARSSLGNPRIAIDDASTGGASHLTQNVKDGILTAEGEIVPGRGQPGWVSLVLLLTPAGEPADLSQYEGIRMRVRVRKGMLSVSANSAEITNFDYHAATVQRTGDEFREVRIPFKDMTRAWSESIALNRSTISSISLVAFDLQKGAFAYDVDEIGFY